MTAVQPTIVRCALGRLTGFGAYRNPAPCRCPGAVDIAFTAFGMAFGATVSSIGTPASYLAWVAATARICLKAWWALRAFRSC